MRTSPENTREYERIWRDLLRCYEEPATVIPVPRGEHINTPRVFQTVSEDYSEPP